MDECECLVARRLLKELDDIKKATEELTAAVQKLCVAECARERRPAAKERTRDK